MEGLRDRNANVTRTHKKNEKPNSVFVSSHASSHTRTPQRIAQPVVSVPVSTGKVGLDEEEMLFLARRCLADELRSRPVIAPVLSEPVFEQPAEIEPLVEEPVVVVRPMRPNGMFQIQRLGFGLVVLKFGWIWLSCGGFIMADSIFCTSDIFTMIFKRMYKHMFQIGDRLKYATRQTGALLIN